MFSTFTAIFEALSFIEQDLSSEITDSQREVIIETLISLRNTMDKCMQYWIKFEERVNQIQERYSISLPDSFPPGFMDIDAEDILGFGRPTGSSYTGPGQGEVDLIEGDEEDEFICLSGEGRLHLSKSHGLLGLSMVSEAAGEFKRLLHSSQILFWVISVSGLPWPNRVRSRRHLRN